MLRNIVQVEATTVKELFDALKDVSDDATFLDIDADWTADYTHKNIVIRVDVSPPVSPKP